MPKTKQTSKKITRKPVAKRKPVHSVAPKSPLPREASAKWGKSPVSPHSPVSPKPSSVSVPVHGIDGKSAGTIALPGELFAAKVNNALVAQAVRVYLANQREGGASTKTRGQVEGSTRKIYRQKGTGRARHGGVRAPIFVGGGITFGPHARDYHLDLPQKMKRAALASALTSAKAEGKVTVVDGFGTLTKTKAMALALLANGVTGSALFVVGSDALMTTRVSRNIEGVDIVSAQNLHAYVIISHPKIVFMKEAVGVLKDRLLHKS